MSSFIFSHRTSNDATHQPVLYEAVMRTAGPVLELGCGEGSTPLLHHVCLPQQRMLFTIDNNEPCLARYSNLMAGDAHRFMLVPEWDSFFRDSGVAERDYGVIFIDSAPWESRAMAVAALKDRATFVVIHDADYFPRHGLFGREHEPLNGASQRGRRDYGDVFMSWQEFFPLEPWPYPLTGPPTLLGSNRTRCELAIDYSRY